MYYYVTVTNTSGAIIHRSSQPTLTNVRTTRRDLINHFTVEDKDWQGDYPDTLTVTAVDPEANTCIELTDLQVNFDY